MEKKLVDEFERAMRSCRHFEEKKMNQHLLNEIGVLRGIAYAMEMLGICPHSEEFVHFIQKQEELKAEEKKMYNI